MEYSSGIRDVLYIFIGHLGAVVTSFELNSAFLAWEVVRDSLSFIASVRSSTRIAAEQCCSVFNVTHNTERACNAVSVGAGCRCFLVRLRTASLLVSCQCELRDGAVPAAVLKNNCHNCCPCYR